MAAFFAGAGASTVAVLVRRPVAAAETGALPTLTSSVPDSVPLSAAAEREERVVLLEATEDLSRRGTRRTEDRRRGQ
ncbi:hypothetical protein GCM10027265_11530 [Jatrophihabitans fulvus]